MAVTARTPTHLSDRVPTAGLQHVLGLLSAIWSLQSVRKLAFSASGAQLHLWVIQQQEALDDMDRASLLDRDFRRVAPEVSLEVHVVPLDHVDEDSLPPAEILFAR